jgi:hypothetical protein
MSACRTRTMPCGKSRLDASFGAPATADPYDCDPVNATQLLHLKQAGSSLCSGQMLRIMILLQLHVRTGQVERCSQDAGG